MAKIKVPVMTSEGVVMREGETVRIINQNEPWSEYTLENGNVIRTKQTVLQIVEMPEKDEAGNPTYTIQSQSNVVVVPGE